MRVGRGGGGGGRGWGRGRRRKGRVCEVVVVVVVELAWGAGFFFSLFFLCFAALSLSWCGREFKWTS